MVERFIAHPKGSQNDETVRQFQELQQYLRAFEERFAALVTDFIVPNFVFSAYGAMEGGPQIGPDIPLGWQRVTAFDTVRVFAPLCGT